MSTSDKIKHAAQSAKGKVQETAGKTAGNERLEAQGQAEQDEARVKHEADKAKDSAKHLGEEAKGKVKEVAGAVGDDDSLEAEGKGEQVAAKAKEHLNK